MELGVVLVPSPDDVRSLTAREAAGEHCRVVTGLDGRPMRMAAIVAALAPDAWRDSTSRMLARCLVGAADRHSLITHLTGLPGMDIGAAGPVEPAQPGDERVDVLVRVLEDRRWRGLALDRLCADLVAALDAGQTQRDAFHSDLQGLLEER